MRCSVSRTVKYNKRIKSIINVSIPVVLHKILDCIVECINIPYKGLIKYGTVRLSHNFSGKISHRRPTRQKSKICNIR